MWTRVLLSIVALFVLAQESFAQEITDNRLTVLGKVRVFAKADRAIIRFDIKGAGKTLGQAFENAKTQMDVVADGLDAIGLTDESLSTSFFQSRENYGNKAFLSSKRDYCATMSATIRTDRLELLQQIIIIISKSKIERISDISFELINYSQLRMDGLKKAVEKAREKANLISEQLGVHCGDVIEFEEIRSMEPVSPLVIGRNKVQSPFNSSLFKYSVGQEGTDGIFAEELHFDSEVRIVYAIENNGTDIIMDDKE